MKLARFALVLTALALAATLPARADALADIKKAGVLKVAVPQDFPPFGTVGADMKPLGYDIDMAELLAKSMGVKVELVPVTSANRIPYLTTRRWTSSSRASAGTRTARKSSTSRRRTRRSSTASSGPRARRSPRRRTSPARRSGYAGFGGGHRAVQGDAPSATVKRYEDNNCTISAFLSGAGRAGRHGQRRGRRNPRKESAQASEVKFLIKDSPCFVGMNKEERRSCGRERGDREAKGDGSLKRDLEEVAGADLPKGL